MDHEIKTTEWWICGPANYTLDVLPQTAKPGMGFVYALLFSTGNIKIGKTERPRSRIKGIAGTLETYGDVTLRTVALSHPRPDFSELEVSLHRALQSERIKSELFRCDVKAVALAMDERTPNIQFRRRTTRQGRKSKPWYWVRRKAWYSTIAGKRIYLGETEEIANLHFQEITREINGHGKAAETVDLERA